MELYARILYPFLVIRDDDNDRMTFCLEKIRESVCDRYE